jgi:RimJ/RimL family protein N-acetyltransferase
MVNYKLRPWSINDLESLVHHANNPKIARFMTDGFPHPYSSENGKAFIEFATKAEPVHIFAIDVSGKAVGGIGIHPQSDIMKKNAELGYWLGEEYWGKGIITSAIKEMVTFAFNAYDITRLYARPFGTNTASQHVLEKAGFKLEARIEKNIFKNGEFLDECIYAVRR